MTQQNNPNVVQAWQEVTQKEAKPRPWFAALLLQKGNQLFNRFVYFYGRLTAVGQRRKRQMAIGLGTAALALALSQTPAHAETITVGAGCTLVQAIQSANLDTAVDSCTAGSGADTIVLAGNTYSYTTTNGYRSALPHITTPITIEANGATIQRTGGDDMRIITINPGGSLTLNNATITGGNVSVFGGGIFMGGGGPLIINNSTISGNTAGTRGGGIYNLSSMTLNNSTVSGNTATDSGGGIGNAGGGVLTLNNSTVTGNTSPGGIGGGVDNFSSTISLNRSIVSGNTASTNREINSNVYAATVNVDNFNIIGHSDDDGSNVTINSPTVVPSGALNTVLNPTLADNGGPTLTHALVSGSPAIDIAPTGSAGLIDQRGAARDFNGDGAASGNEADAGAVEFRAPEQNCDLDTVNDIAVNGITFSFASLGTLSCVTVEEMGANHLRATGLPSNAGIHTGNWWHISGNVSNGFEVRVTLPHTVDPHTDAKVCKFPGTQGGFGWDCFRTGSDAGTVWLDEVDSFSDWAVGDEVGPTAVTALTQQTTPTTSNPLPALLATLLTLLTSAWLWARRQAE